MSLTPLASGSTQNFSTPDGSVQDLPLEVLGAQICGLASRLAQATYHWLRMIAAFDKRNGWVGVGIKSCAHWLAWTCSMAPGTAREHVRVAHRLTDLPLVSQEMAGGRLSYTKVREITRVADRVNEVTLVELARTATASQLMRTVRAFRRCDRDRIDQEHARKVHFFTDDDGSVVLSARLPAEEGALVIAALEAARGDLEGEEKISQPDMLLQVARGYLAVSPRDRSGEDRTTVVVHVNATELLGPNAHSDSEKRSRGNVEIDKVPVPDHSAVPADCCEIAGVGGIGSKTATRLSCDADVIGMIRGAGGAVLAHGRKRRLVSAAQRRVLAVRDGHCQFPSCHRKSHLEAHHVVPWSRGGPTDLQNLVLLCRFHHMACHEGGVVITHEENSSAGAVRWQFTTPRGEVLTNAHRAFTGPGWKADKWLLWHGLDGASGWKDPEAVQIRSRWAGERALLVDMVAVLFDNRRHRSAETSTIIAA